MKTTFLLTFLTCGGVISSYSQINQHHKRDTTSNDAAIFKNEIKVNLGNQNWKTVNDSWNTLTLHKFGQTKSDHTRKWNSEILSTDRMPCYNQKENLQ